LLAPRAAEKKEVVLKKYPNSLDNK
jgi:hypothetical protein